jgi:quercetin dioxygenase-like cupin family protein
MKHALLVLALSTFAGMAHASDPAQHVMVLPEQMQWTAIPALPPGATGVVLEGPLDQAVPFTLRLRLPAGYRIPPHWHPAVERVTVLSGTFLMGLGERFDEAGLTRLQAGSLAMMPVGVRHFAMTTEATELQLHGTGPWAIHYVDPADDPRSPAK